jgi:hypothetical protein
MSSSQLRPAVWCEGEAQSFVTSSFIMLLI